MKIRDWIESVLMFPIVYVVLMWGKCNECV